MRTRFRRALRSVALSLVACVGTLAAQDSPTGAGVEVVFLDVGQGDAVLIRSLEGNAALIDAGPGRAVVRELGRFGITSLDLLVASHPHKDHIGGIIPMLQTISVGSYLDNGQQYHSQEWRFMERLLDELEVPRIAPVSQVIQLGSATIRVLPPPDGEGWSTNNRSVGILLEYGEFSALFTGDSEREELAHFVALGLPQVTLLKAAHHGASNGVNPGWILVTKPQVVVVSAGRGNAFGHPEPLAMRYYARFAKAIYRTDLHGAVRITGYLDGSWRADTDAD